MFVFVFVFVCVCVCERERERDVRGMHDLLICGSAKPSCVRCVWGEGVTCKEGGRLRKGQQKALAVTTIVCSCVNM